MNEGKKERIERYRGKDQVYSVITRMIAIEAYLPHY